MCNKAPSLLIIVHFFHSPSTVCGEELLCVSSKPDRNNSRLADGVISREVSSLNISPSLFRPAVSCLALLPLTSLSSPDGSFQVIGLLLKPLSLASTARATYTFLRFVPTLSLHQAYHHLQAPASYLSKS